MLSLFGQNQRDAGVCDTDSKVGDTNYSFQETENRSESFMLLFFFGLNDPGAKKSPLSSTLWLFLYRPGEHTTTGCGSDPVVTPSLRGGGLL